MIRGWGISHPVVWQALLVTLAWGVLFFGLSVLAIQPPVGYQKFTAALGRFLCCNKKKTAVDAESHVAGAVN